MKINKLSLYIHRLVFIVFGRNKNSFLFRKNKGAKSFFFRKIKGAKTFSTNKRDNDFFRKIKGAKLFFRLKEGGGETFFKRIFPKTRSRNPVNFDRSLNT